MTQKLITNDGAVIYTESFGNPAHPAVLLIMGAQSSLVWWQEAFCHYLADEGRFVIRYDNRDTGLSTTYEPGQPGYTFEDMADDAIHILDGYGIEQAHIVGMSMGGMLAQMIALRHKSRVRTITLLATSNFAAHLPPMEEKIMDYFSNAGQLDWTDTQAVINFNIDKSKLLSGSKNPFDLPRISQLAEEEARRSSRMESINNHVLVSGGEHYLTRTSEIDIPALVIHGTEDPIIPYPHGQHLADTIPGATLVTLEGSGHELHHHDWDAIIGAIRAHTSIRCS
ncbi:alpha/beta hydrolase [Paenibacillus sp. 1011MAR3C5]|uniref:alpha/beta fold hydrolase n=1 Tax=Paenibacillus sp. 1011MAR3C5 TaxID=1675787 RepID=UPI000E6D0DEB|nr:alpha/beta hydrolase [Paenibacillus sp. 1011MAR3C5]RJE86050.1 alpha/beta hydrolase [Paenibacillus sp. 1011MAR3C5]